MGIPKSRAVASSGRAERKRVMMQRESGNGTLPIQAGSGHVVGVDIGASNLRVALADMNGKMLGKWSASTKETSSPAMVIEQIRTGVESLLEQACVPRRSLLAVAAGAPGITDTDAGIVVATSYLRGWKDVPLQSLLRAALGVPAAVENDVRMAAIGENWRGAGQGVADFVFLAIGTGIAAGMFANGRLIHGADFAAGEIGYMHVPGTPEEAAQDGAPGSLESVISGEGVRQQWLRCCTETGVAVSDGLSATDIFERARAGDELAAGILHRSARILAYAVYNVSLVLNCKLFVLGGGVGMSEPLRDCTRHFLDQFNEPVRPKLTVSSLGKDAQLIGAIRLAMNKAESQIGMEGGG